MSLSARNHDTHKVKTMTKQTKKGQRARALASWAAEIGGEVALRRLLRTKAAVVSAALAGQELGEADAAKIDAALAQRAELGEAHYSRHLRALRAELGLRSQDVAVGTGLTHTRMTEYESGRVVPDLSTALALWRFWAGHFPALRMDQLFGGEVPVGELLAQVKGSAQAGA